MARQGRARVDDSPSSATGRRGTAVPSGVRVPLRDTSSCPKVPLSHAEAVELKSKAIVTTTREKNGKPSLVSTRALHGRQRDRDVLWQRPAVDARRTYRAERAGRMTHWSSRSAPGLRACL